MSTGFKTKSKVAPWSHSAYQMSRQLLETLLLELASHQPEQKHEAEEVRVESVVIFEDERVEQQKQPIDF